MGSNVEAKGATVAVNVCVALANADVGDGVVITTCLINREPVLGRGVAVTREDGWQAGHGVIDVGDAVLGAVLVGDEVREHVVASAGGPVGVEVDGETARPQVGSAQSGYGAAEGVTGGDNFEAGVVGESLVDGVGNTGRHLTPSLVEARVRLSTISQVKVGKAEVDVGNPVANVGAAASREDNLLADSVDGHVTGNTSPEATGSHFVRIRPHWYFISGNDLLERANNGRTVGLHLVAGTATGYLSSGLDVGGVAVGSSGVFGVEIEVVNIDSTDLCKEKATLAHIAL